MALFLQHKTDDIQWAVWKMEESLDALLALLPDARRIFCEQELNRFVSERRKMEWLSVRVLLYSMLREDKEIGYSSEGKPYLADRSFFFISSRTSSVSLWDKSANLNVSIGYPTAMSVLTNRRKLIREIQLGACYCIGLQRKRFLNVWRMLTPISASFV